MNARYDGDSKARRNGIPFGTRVLLLLADRER